jgi:hypothetical protein
MKTIPSEKNLLTFSLDLDPDPQLDPDPHSSKRLDPDSHIMYADPKQWFLFLSASPATYDFCVSLDRDFSRIVVDKLSQLSRKALLEQQDPASFSEINRKKIEKEILTVVFGK